MKNRIGIDLGGTKIDAIVLSDDGKALFSKRLLTPKIYGEIVSTIVSLVNEAGEIAGPTAKVGIGSPGSQSPKTGLWRNANILVCNGKPFALDLQSAIDRTVRLENDANCFALSEATDGAGQGHAIVAFFTIGTALGGGLVIDGRLRTGHNGEAAEFGHTPLPWPNETEWPLLPCFCGKKGCAEQYVSGTGLQRDYRKTTDRDLTGREIVARAQTGESQAQQALDRLADRLARVTANIVNVIDPDIFVIGGGLNELPELVENLPPRVASYSFSGTADVKVVRAAHGETSGVRGAARLWD